MKFGKLIKLEKGGQPDGVADDCLVYCEGLDGIDTIPNRACSFCFSEGRFYAFPAHHPIYDTPVTTWHKQRACDLMNNLTTPEIRFSLPMDGCHHVVRAFAKYIAKHEQPPEPDIAELRLKKAEEIVGNACELEAECRDDRYLEIAKQALELLPDSYFTGQSQ